MPREVVTKSLPNSIVNLPEKLFAMQNWLPGAWRADSCCTLLSSEKTADMPDEEVLAAGAAAVGPLGWNRLPGGGGGGAAGPPLEGPVSRLLSANAVQTSKCTVRSSYQTPNAA